MDYEMMFPKDLKKALDENWPAILVLGVTEFHANNCVFGTDTIVARKIIEELEQERDMVILPRFCYGAASYAVAAPEKNGTVHIPSETLAIFARDLFSSLLRIGFRNVHCIYSHQTENSLQGMPTDLAFKLGARQAIFAFLEKEHGEGWWGNEESSDYYENHNGKGKNPFNWIQVHPCRAHELRHKYPGDHAGIAETSIMLALCPEGTDMNAPRTHWFTRSANHASAGYGRECVEAMKIELKKVLFK